MKKLNNREEIAERKALERLDYILETHVTPYFVQVIGTRGGDIVAYRIYDDGHMYEK